MKNKVYLIRLSGDVTYRKSGSRFYFERLVVNNIRNALIKMGVNGKVIHEPARIFVFSNDLDSSIFSKIFGISSYSECNEYEFSNLDELIAQIENDYKEKVKDKSFAIKCRRSGTHNFTSMDVAKLLGSRLKPYAKKVDLENPDITIYIEIRENKAYVFEEILQGPGGLPIGSGDKVLSLFSGGFDSPVASWFVAKRGSKVDFLHLSFGGLSEVLPVFLVARYLYNNWFYGYKSRFFVLRFSAVIKEILSKLPNMIWQVALRRMMYLVAERVALEYGEEAIVTGESIAQATSQTLRNLRVAEYGISLPILRPLIGFDKNEIINLAKRIGTYDLSLNVEELCGIAIGPLTPRADLEMFFKNIENIDKSVIDKSLSTLEEYDLDEDLEKIKQKMKDEDYVLDYIPSNAIVVNLMPDKLKLDRAINIEMFDEEKYKNDIILFVCEKGLTSKGLAKFYREAGFKAYSLAGGFENYKKIVQKGF